MDGEYRFKKHQLSSIDRAWLEEASKPGFQPQVAKVRLRKVIPHDFFPDQLDGRLYVSGQITPVGLWHLNSHHPRLIAVDRVIRAIKKQIESELFPKEVVAAELAKQTGLQVEEVSEAFYLLGTIGHYFHTARSSPGSSPRSYDRIELTDQNSYDNYLHYDGIDDLLERFYRWRGQHLYGKDRAISEMESAGIEVKRTIEQNPSEAKTESETRADRMLAVLKNNRIIAIVIVVGIVIIALGNFVDAARKIFSFSSVSSDDNNSRVSAPPAGGSPKSAQTVKECLEKELATLKARQEFSQPGGVRCEGAGPSPRGVSRSANVVYTAPPGFRIVVPAVVHETSNIDGSMGTIEYFEENGEPKKASVAISCRSENKPFGAGASEQVVLAGSIERVVSSIQVEAIKARCE